jgi:hypothetical protein
VKALNRALTDASPTGIPAAYRALVACDTKAALSATPAAFQRILAGDDANPAVVSAITIGGAESVRTWLATLEPDQRSNTLGWLGDQCKTDPIVEGFFVESHDLPSSHYFEHRWFRALDDCTTPKIRGLLEKDLEAQRAATIKGGDRTLFLAILEVYARNLGADAIPTLVKLGKELESEEDLTYVVSAFADAADVGSANGTNPQTAVKATQGLVEIAEELPPKAVDQARTTLIALGAEEDADRFATWRWKDRKVDGKYRYALVATAVVTCKNGKKQAYFHSSHASEPGRQWPDQLQALVGEKLDAEWDVSDPAARCKGTGDYKYLVPPEPFADDTARETWLKEQKKAFDNGIAAGADKVMVVPHEPVEL